MSDLVPDTIFGKFAYAFYQQGIPLPQTWLWIIPTPGGGRVQFFQLPRGIMATDWLDEVLRYGMISKVVPY